LRINSYTDCKLRGKNRRAPDQNPLARPLFYKKTFLEL
jgi:hypothetical protein